MIYKMRLEIDSYDKTNIEVYNVIEKGDDGKKKREFVCMETSVGNVMDKRILLNNDEVKKLIEMLHESQNCMD
jgi:hypothetical protein